MAITAYDECWVDFFMSRLEAKLHIMNEHLFYHLADNWDYAQEKILGRLNDERVKVACLMHSSFIKKNDLTEKSPEEVAMLFRKMAEAILDLIEEGVFKEPKGSCFYSDIRGYSRQRFKRND